jgi:hypothetical protein
MDFERAAVDSGIVRPEHVAKLLLRLKDRNFAWVVCSPSQNAERLQGDLFYRMPIALVDDAGTVRSKNFTAMLLNNVCDLQPGRSKFVTLAPVEEFEAFAADMLGRDQLRAQHYLESIRANHIDEFFYLPNCPQLPKGGIVRFDLLSSVSASVYEQAITGGRRLASLTRDGFYFLLMKLTHFLARPESYEIVRSESAANPNR